MVATWCPAASSRYYTQQTEYYLAEGSPSGQWYCPSRQLNVADDSTVQSAHFEQLFAGLNAGGKSLLANARADRVPAFDITLSAPRSVSLLWAFGSADTRMAIERAQARATRTTLDLLEREAAYARRGRGGRSIERVPLVAACFQHGESRPAEHTDGRVFADPNLHTHCVVLNLAERADGTVGAIHSTVLRDWKMAAGATYHAALAYELQSLGFGIDRVGKNGIFEIAGINEAAITYFSARRQDIESELAAAGTTSTKSSALAAVLAKSTRKNKLEYSAQDQDRHWWEAAEANAIDAEQLEAAAREVAIWQTNTFSVLSVADRLAALSRELTETQSVIDRRELLRAATEALVGAGLSPEQITNEADQLIARGDFIALGADAIGQLKYSTPEMIQIEREVVTQASQLARSTWLAIDPAVIQRQCRQQRLSAEQAAAAVIASAGNRIAVIEGAPGSGKTTTLTPIVEAYREAGCRVLGAASAWRIANMLRDDLQIESRAVASWLEQSYRGNPFLDASTLLIVDEAGLLSSRDMHTILGAVRQSGAKLLLVGDREQLQAIGAGPGLSLVTRAVEQARVSSIVRQHDAWARDAIAALGRGDSDVALNAFAQHGLLIEADSARSTVRVVVDQWAQNRHQHPKASQLLIAKTNAEVAAISREVRSRLQVAGVVHGTEITFQAATPSGHVTSITLAAGDQARFLARNDALGVINGTTATIVQVSEYVTARGEQIQRIVADVEGRRITFSPSALADEKGRARLGWAYASTVYGAQGLTVDRATVLINSTFDRHDGYVAASRARYSTVLVTDKSSLDRDVQSALVAGSTAQRLANEPVTVSERRSRLAATLSRSSLKQSTLDIADFGTSEPEFTRQQRRLSAEVALER